MSESPKLLDRHQVLEIVPLCRTTLYKLMDKGEFPQPVHIGVKLAWYEDEVYEWINSRPRARRKGQLSDA